MSAIVRPGNWERRRYRPNTTEVDRATAASKRSDAMHLLPLNKSRAHHRLSGSRGGGTRKVMALVDKLFPKRPETAPTLHG